MIVERSQNLLVAAVLLAGLTGALSAQAQCVGSTTQIVWVNGVIRTAANNVQTNLGTQIVGDYSDTWEASVTASETFQSVTIHASKQASVGYGGNDWTNYPPGASATAAGYTYNDAPSSQGPGTFTASSSHVAQSECGNYQTYSQTRQYTVSQPTISGLWGTRSYWNLGPGSSDPQPTTGGYYYQSVSLTFNTNCSSGDTCSGTPTWNLTTSSNQATLSSTSGSTTTLKPGSTAGNCQYVSTLTANIGGFSTPSYTIAYNSPASLRHIYGEVTNRLGSVGYQTSWSESLYDACNPADILLPLPLGEAFSSFSLVNGGGGTWGVPYPGGVNYSGLASTYYTYDYIGQSGTTQVPAVLYDRAGPPYTGNTVYFQGGQTVNAGTESGTTGIPVYTGTLQYYTDHGGKTP